MSKISELRLHARNRKLPSVMHLSDITPELLLHNLFIYEDLSKDPANLSGIKTAEERHDNAVAGVARTPIRSSSTILAADSIRPRTGTFAIL